MKIDAEKSKIYSFSDPVGDLYMCGMLHTGKWGYFSDRPDFADCVDGFLGGMNIHEKHDANNYFPFRVGSGVATDIFKYFCPEEYAVGTPELRPYKTLNELPFKVGDSVTFRKKGAKEQMMLICVGIAAVGTQLDRIHLGGVLFDPVDLFEEYEYFNGKEWKPFGVEA